MLTNGTRKFVSIALTGFVALFSTAAARTAVQTSQVAKPHPGTAAPRGPGAASPSAQSGSFTVSQLGHAVGTAEFRVVPGAAGYDSTSTVRVSMKGLEYALSKTEQLDSAHHILHVILSATVNNQAVNVTGKPDRTGNDAAGKPVSGGQPDGGSFLLNISANGRSTTTRLAGHAGAVLLPDFDPGALQTLLTIADAQNGRDLWAIVPKQAGNVQAVQLATFADEQGTLDGSPVTVHHLVATIAGVDTDLFVGPGNQLVQAELPQQGFSLVRKGFVLTPPKRPGTPPATEKQGTEIQGSKSQGTEAPSRDHAETMGR